MEELILNNGTVETEQDWLPAIVSIQMQEYGDTYDVEKGFDCGTVFPALNKPFKAGGM